MPSNSYRIHHIILELADPLLWVKIGAYLVETSILYLTLCFSPTVEAFHSLLIVCHFLIDNFVFEGFFSYEVCFVIASTLSPAASRLELLP